jgi:serine/threonine protein kinase
LEPIPESYKRLIRSLLSRNPFARPSVDEILDFWAAEHPSRSDRVPSPSRTVFTRTDETIVSEHSSDDELTHDTRHTTFSQTSTALTRRARTETSLLPAPQSPNALTLRARAPPYARPERIRQHRRQSSLPTIPGSTEGTLRRRPTIGSEASEDGSNDQHQMTRTDEPLDLEALTSALDRHTQPASDAGPASQTTSKELEPTLRLTTITSSTSVLAFLNLIDDKFDKVITILRHFFAITGHNVSHNTLPLPVGFGLAILKVSVNHNTVRLC